jgi:hypothetical protein
VLALRPRQQRNLLTTLLLSHGVPMLLEGDELGRSQAIAGWVTRRRSSASCCWLVEGQQLRGRATCASAPPVKRVEQNYLHPNRRRHV